MMTTTSESLVECSHCLLKIKKNSAITETLSDGNKIYFCCSGCQSVYHFVKDGGLDKFYEIRKGYIPGSIKKIKVDEDLFVNDIKRINEKTSEISLFISDIRCAACIWLIENSLKKLNGVSYVRVNYATHKMTIQFDENVIKLHDILTTITNLGYCPIPSSMSTTNDLLEKEKKEYFVRFVVAGFFSMQLMLYSIALYAGYFQGIEKEFKGLFTFITFLLATPVVFYAGKPFMANTFSALKNKTLNMDCLIFLGSFSAYLYSIYAMFTGEEVYFDSSAMIITLILLGRFIESSIKLKASKEMLLLKSLQPRQVKKISSLPANLDNAIGLITRIEEVKKDDLILIYEDEVVPLDCKIIKGTTEIDESMLTGESLPVTKMEGSMIFSGTKNITNKIAAKVERDYKQSTISKIIEAIEKAQNTSFKTQKAVDRVISIFVPSVITVAFLTFLGWMYINGNIESSLIKAVSVLVISCPCALGIATPLALLISTNIATKNGIIIKNGDILEEMRNIKQIFFDKTGTLTEGKLNVSQVITIGNTDKISLLSYVASLEKHSSHPIGKGLLDYYDGDLLPVETVTEIPGKGVTGKTKDGIQIAAGNISLMSDTGVSIDDNIENIIKKLQQEGHITVLIAIDGNLSGIIAFKDKLKKDTQEVIRYLYEKHYSINVVTGDNETSANTILTEVKNKIKIYASMTPFDKAELIREHENKNIKTIFIGDGINDAPSIKSATVGIAMGSGSELAIETSDAVILNNSLRSIVKLFNLSHYTLLTIKINLFWAFIYNILMIPLAATGYIHPVISAGSMSISSIIVVLNSLRLRLYNLYKPAKT